MGITSTTTQISPFIPICPSYFKLSRSCPCFASREGSSRPFSVALHRFWGKIPLQVIDDMQKRDEKKRVVSRNSNAPPGLEFTTILRDGTRTLWKQESNELLKQKCEYDGSVYSFKYERMDINAIQTQDKPKSQRQLISRNVGQLVDNKRPNGSSLDDILKESVWNNGSFMQRMENEKQFQSSELGHTGIGSNEQVQTNGKPHKPDIRERLTSIYESVLVVDNIAMAKEVVSKLTNQYRHLIHACDTEVAKIDVKEETPIDHGEITCVSIYCGPEADFGHGKSCIWVDVLDGGGRDLLNEFALFFEDPDIKKVWHNYSFDNHVIENYGFSVSGFHADTMHMARLWDSSRRLKGGYSLEALTGDQKVMHGAGSCYKELIGKVSMKTIFGKKKLKKDGSEGKMTIIAPVEELQREEREPWICYSALDAISTLQLYKSMESQLSKMPWNMDGKRVFQKSMFDFYQEYWQPFGEILVRMETEGMLVDRAYLAEMEKVAKAEQEDAANRFRNWACKYCPDAKYMNVGSDTQLRQLLFGGVRNSKNPRQTLPEVKTFKVPNVDKVIEEGKKTPTKYRNIQLCSIGVDLPIETYTASGWPSVSGVALKTLAGMISDGVSDAAGLQLDDAVLDDSETMTDEDLNSEGSYVAENKVESECVAGLRRFQTLEKRIEACHAIASLCEVCSIDSLISNFILPCSSNISGKGGRVHCSLNINTETGRLSARRPNLQNQPALEKDRYKIRQAFIAAPGNSLIVADYGQLELRILAHLANCKSMLDAFKAGGDFHSRTAMNMYPHIHEAIEKKQVLLEWYPQPGEDKPPRKAKMLNFSIAYGKTPVGLSRDWKVSVAEAKETVNLWYKERKEVLKWQRARKKEAREYGRVFTLLGRARVFPLLTSNSSLRGHVERAAINTPVQGSAADVAMCAMLEISKNTCLKELGWKLLLQVHDEVILEGPTESAEVARAIVVECMSKPFGGKNFLNVDLVVDSKCAQNWYAAK
ncbi:DNA polymerase [Salix suchowensis]|nr:DNA polymerase [Salix suchowensis]